MAGEIRLDMVTKDIKISSIRVNVELNFQMVITTMIETLTVTILIVVWALVICK